MPSKFGNNSLGFFGGVEGGVNIIYSDDELLNKNGSTFAILSAASAQIGISLFLSQHHRMEVISKIPFLL
ncbi:hypothetical protein [Helicobacter cappadocius]|uniref:Uncharacterized protein n=1 Tax=Helicobacter cappadocius TaxID=3063998 RepID=A0AA90SSR9_9HELI|nr:MULTISPECIES: hypothetical protein [unclassified Helicobacter]MDO7253331.1 hypothetical protein [Helicobacter sp. faydin-H75]MDP2539239.1 hypothetical protein [Helicobacter sp. faydin-H76]